VIVIVIVQSYFYQNVNTNDSHFDKETQIKNKTHTWLRLRLVVKIAGRLFLC